MNNARDETVEARPKHIKKKKYIHKSREKQLKVSAYTSKGTPSGLGGERTEEEASKGQKTQQETRTKQTNRK